MKLGRTTASRLESAREALATAESKIAELLRQRSAVLADVDDLVTVHSIDLQLEGQRRNVSILTERIAVLESAEQRERAKVAEEQYRRAVAAMEKPLERRGRAAQGIETAFANLAGSVKEFMIATESVLKVWPADVEFPSRAYPGACLSLERLGALVRDVFVPSRGHADRRPPQPSEFVTRAADADRHRAFASIERQLGEEWLSDLRTAHNPVPAADTPGDESEAA